MGISPEDLIPLFEKYFRVKSPTGYHVAGTGLGLPVARAIVEAHGGRIWAESKVGQGTTLYFSLPRAGSERGDCDLIGFDAKCPSGLGDTMPEARILVVDDEPKLVRLVREVLTATGFDVMSTGSGENAVEMAALERPDLIVLDIVLSGAMDGYEVSAPRARIFRRAHHHAHRQSARSRPAAWL